MHEKRQCPKCGALGQMKFGYCENCKLISPRPPIIHKFAPTRRRLLKQAIILLGAFYSPVKDACVGLRKRFAPRATLIRVAVSDSVQIRDKVSLSATLSPSHATVVHKLIPGVNAPGGQHHGQA
jgi:hypothetical protein